MQELLNIVNKILAAKKKQPLDALNPHMHLRNDFGFTSFDLAELTVKIEAVFEVDIFENGLVHTIGDIQSILFKEAI